MEESIERKALYNLLRMNWQSGDSCPDVEEWQVEDYRLLREEELYTRLEDLEVELDHPSLIAYAETCDSPEELTDYFVGDVEDLAIQDRIYLLLFELWRRFVPDKPSLSIFCDELDYQIDRFDKGDLEEDDQDLQDMLANLQDLLEDNTDGEGGEPQEIFDCVAQRCANDVASFLYDFIAEQIDNGDTIYASELLDGFSDYLPEKQKFMFLQARIIAERDPEKGQKMLAGILEEEGDEYSLDFVLDMLHFMVQNGGQKLFIKLVQLALPLLDNEEDFQDLLALCADFYRCSDVDAQDQAIQALIKKRTSVSPDREISLQDPDITSLLRIMDVPLQNL